MDQSIAYRRTKLSMTPKNVTTNSTYSSLRDASIGNESNSANNSANKVRANPCASRVEGVVDFPVVSGASYARTGNCSESRRCWSWTKEKPGHNLWVFHITLMVFVVVDRLIDVCIATRKSQFGHASGPCASVYLAIDSNTGQMVAVKQRVSRRKI
jgi:hypothetical protein